MYLIHMLECVEKIQRYTRDGQDAFFESSLIQDGVIRNFEIIGEAAKQVSAETRSANPEIPWSKVAGFRDVLIHGYMGVELSEVWTVVERDLADLEGELRRILQERGWSPRESE